MNNIKTLLATLNNNPFDIKFSIMDDEECTSEDYVPGVDIGIYFDGCDDDFHDDKEKIRTMREWLFDIALPSITICFKENGYVDAVLNDGSGNGLYYGMTIYKPAI